ncbi:MAG: DUF3000 family protein [Aquiluna sp.]|nr:DUF3000 family protein [Aquiluna sp.]
MKLDLTGITEPFASMLAEMNNVQVRKEISIVQIPSPKGIAPEAIAISAEIVHETASDHGVSRLVFCRDPGMPEGWHSELRVIGYAKSPIELEMAKDDYSAALPWEWLKDTLQANRAGFAHAAGTTTTVISTGHGELISQPQHAELEIRASWAPLSFDLAAHLQGWLELLALISGLPPKETDVTRIS